MSMVVSSSPLCRVMVLLGISGCLVACLGKEAEVETAGPEFGGKNGTLQRLATLPMGAEVAGFVETEQGDLFFNVQHPFEHHSDNPANNQLSGGVGLARIGVIEGLVSSQIPVQFEQLSVPVSETDKSEVRLVKGNYKVLARERDTFAGAIPHGLGVIPSFDTNIGLDETSLPESLRQSQDPKIRKHFGEALSSDMPDLNVFVPLTEDSSKGYLYTAWESRPSTMSRIAIEKTDGSWQVRDNDAILLDFNTEELQGAWHLCSGSLTPWGTPLANEEFFADDDLVNWNNPDPRNLTFARAFGGAAFLNPDLTEVELRNYDEAGVREYATALRGTIKNWPNPYRYGYALEIEQPLAASPLPKKRFAMGRYTHEVALVMPDLKTVYLTSDDRPSGFFKFVADEAGNMESGTLFAIKLKQDKPSEAFPGTTGFDVSWVELGRSNDRQIETLVAAYDHIGLKPYGEEATSYVSQDEIDAYAEQYRRDGRADNPALAFIETRAVAIALGATVELDGVEGLTANFERLQRRHAEGKTTSMYMAASYMRDSVADKRGDIQLAENLCGQVFRLDMNSDFDVVRMEPEVTGGPYKADALNRCSLESVAQPDNILELADGRLLIGEDTRSHINNMIWVYTPDAVAQELLEK